jgi:hypothetical protein
MNKQSDMSRFGSLNKWQTVWNRFLGVSIGHGYRLLRPVIFGLGVMVVGTLIFWWGYDHGLLVSTADQVNQTSAKGSTFFAPMYSVDTFLPIIDFGQESAWQPLANSYGGWFILVSYWVEIGLGWIVSTLFVLGFTRLVRDD